MEILWKTAGRLVENAVEKRGRQIVASHFNPDWKKPGNEGYFFTPSCRYGTYMGSTELKVLVVDDDVDLRAALTEYISKMGVKVRTAGSVHEAQTLLRTESVPFDLVLTDLKIPGGSGMDVLRATHLRNSESLVTIITGYASMETAIEAIRLGAYNYIAKPFSLNEIGVLVRNMIERVTLSKENARLSLRLQELYQEMNRVQSERSDVLRSYEVISRQLQETTHKLDQLLHLHFLKPAVPKPVNYRPSDF